MWQWPAVALALAVGWGPVGVQAQRAPVPSPETCAAVMSLARQPAEAVRLVADQLGYQRPWTPTEVAAIVSPVVLVTLALPQDVRPEHVVQALAAQVQQVVETGQGVQVDPLGPFMSEYAGRIARNWAVCQAYGR